MSEDFHSRLSQQAREISCFGHWCVEALDAGNPCRPYRNLAARPQRGTDAGRTQQAGNSCAPTAHPRSRRFGVQPGRAIAQPARLPAADEPVRQPAIRPGPGRWRPQTPRVGAAAGPPAHGTPARSDAAPSLAPRTRPPPAACVGLLGDAGGGSSADRPFLPHGLERTPESADRLGFGRRAAVPPHAGINRGRLAPGPQRLAAAPELSRTPGARLLAGLDQAAGFATALRRIRWLGSPPDSCTVGSACSGGGVSHPPQSAGLVDAVPIDLATVQRLAEVWWAPGRRHGPR
jgi:hypothetical protein